LHVAIDVGNVVCVTVLLAPIDHGQGQGE
jgi:hypothetical protein